MKHIQDFTFRGHEIILMQDSINGSYAVDIRADDFDGDIIAGYNEFKRQDDARYCAMAFVDGLKRFSL